MSVKGYEVQSAKGKGTWGAVPRKPGTSVPRVLSQGSLMECVLIPPAMSHDITCNVSSAKEAH